MKSPLHTYNVFQSTNVEETHALVSQSLSKHTFRTVKGVKSLDARFDSFNLSNCSLFYMRYGAEVYVEPDASMNFFLVQLPIAGTIKVHSNKCDTLCSQTCGTVISPANITSFSMDRDLSLLTFKFDEVSLENRLTHLLQQELTRGRLTFDIDFDLCSPLGQFWRSNASFICAQATTLYNQSKPLTYFKQSTGNLLMDFLLESQPHNYSTLLSEQSYECHPRHVMRAVDYIHENIHRPISMAELARVACVSARTLQNSFQKFKNKSPGQYIRDTRLQYIYEEILHNKGAALSALTDKYGISNMGRFAQAFKEKYGQLPSELQKDKH